jgi:S-adenosylmethionine:tRNA ribosyltransferase-isomerase
MTAAGQPTHRREQAKLLYIAASGRIYHTSRCSLADFLSYGDLVIANDAATLPASLHGTHLRSGAPVEVRLAGRASLAHDDVARFDAVVFGSGDYRQRTEDRPLPPSLRAGDRLQLGPLLATVERLSNHPRLVGLRFEGSPAQIWQGLAAHGRPIQYAHLHEPLALWDVWTPIAGPPVAYEAPSAGFALDWQLLASFESRGIQFATVTHAAGISSTGDPDLDRRLPFDEPYRIPQGTAHAIHQAAREHRRVIAVGTSVVRALEHSAARFGLVLPGIGVATQRIGADTQLRVVDVILSGVHEPGTSHHDLLRAFVTPEVLSEADRAMGAAGFASHEFGDSVLIERARVKYSARVATRGADSEAIFAPNASTGRAGGGAYTSATFRADPAHVVQEPRRLPPAGRLVGLRR